MIFQLNLKVWRSSSSYLMCSLCSKFIEHVLLSQIKLNVGEFLIHYFFAYTRPMLFAVWHFRQYSVNIVIVKFDDFVFSDIHFFINFEHLRKLLLLKYLKHFRLNS